MPTAKTKRNDKGTFVSDIPGKNRNMVMRVYPEEKELLLKLRKNVHLVKCMICKQNNYFSLKSLEGSISEV